MYCTRAAILVISLAELSDGKLFLFQCPTPPTRSNFQPILYVGRWYEQYRYLNTFEWWGRCTTADYNLTSVTNIAMRNTQVNLRGTSTFLEGIAYPDENIYQSQYYGKYRVNYPSLAGNTWGKYWVVETDYTSFSIVWSCTYYWGFNNQELWILTRDKNAGSNDLQNYRDIAWTRGLQIWPLMNIAQNC